MNTIVRYEYKNGVAMEFMVDEEVKSLSENLLRDLYNDHFELFLAHEDSPIINIELRKGHGL